MSDLTSSSSVREESRIFLWETKSPSVFVFPLFVSLSLSVIQCPPWCLTCIKKSFRGKKYMPFIPTWYSPCSSLPPPLKVTLIFHSTCLFLLTGLSLFDGHPDASSSWYHVSHLCCYVFFFVFFLLLQAKKRADQRDIPYPSPSSSTIRTNYMEEPQKDFEGNLLALVHLHFLGLVVNSIRDEGWFFLPLLLWLFLQEQ